MTILWQIAKTDARPGIPMRVCKEVQKASVLGQLYINKLSSKVELKRLESLESFFWLSYSHQQPERVLKHSVSLVVKIAPKQITRTRVDLIQIFQKVQTAGLVILRRVATKLAIVINEDDQYELESKCSQLECKCSTQPVISYQHM